MSRFITAALLLLAGAPVCSSQANGAAIFQVGPMWCGAVRRSINTVQTYCLQPGSNSATVENTIRTVSVNTLDPTRYALIVTFQYFYNPTSAEYVNIIWSFRIAGTGMDFDFRGCQSIVNVPERCQTLTSTFPVVYSATVDPCISQLGATVSGQCRCLQLDKPRGCTLDLTFPWTGVLATITGQKTIASISHGCITWPRNPFPALQSNTQSLCGVTNIGPSGEVMGQGQWLGFWLM